MREDIPSRSRARPAMKEIAELAIDVAVSSGATYADCRVVQRGIQAMTVKDGRFAEVSSFEDEGVGIRVLVDGAWGFASIDRLDSESLGDAARLACRIARASSRLRRQAVRLAPAPVVTGEYRTPMERDPFDVSLEEKMDLLIRADEAMAAVTGVTTHEASLAFVREHRLFASSEGSLTDQVIVESGGGMDATATSEDDVQTRSFPNSFGRHQLCAGYEAILAMDLAGNAPRIGAEAVALLGAQPCPTGRMTLILDGTQAALQVHEVLRAPHRAGPRPRRRGRLRRNLLPHPRPARPLPLRQRAGDHQRRRHHARRAGHLRLGRRGGGGAADRPRRPRRLPRLHVVARDRGRLRLDEQRGDARRVPGTASR